MARRLTHAYRRSLRARIKYPALGILVVMVLVMATVAGLLLRNSMRETARQTCRQQSAQKSLRCIDTAGQQPAVQPDAVGHQ